MQLTYECLRQFDKFGDQYLVEFINDTISFHLKNHKVPFLSKYSEIIGGAYYVVPIREATIELIKLVLRQTDGQATLDLYKQAVVGWFTQQGFNFEIEEGEAPPLNLKTIDIIATTVYARRNELRTILTEIVLGGCTDKQLIDYNFNIEMVVSSNSSQRVMQPLLVLELMLRVD